MECLWPQPGWEQVGIWSRHLVPEMLLTYTFIAGAGLLVPEQAFTPLGNNTILRGDTTSLDQLFIT